MQPPHRIETLLFFLAVFAYERTLSFSMKHNAIDKLIFGIPNSGWQAPQWNWGSAIGTGHDCARICRRHFNTVAARQDYVRKLKSGDESATDTEEIKLTLALTWQRGRWDGSDGGRNGYGQVLALMAQAERYENEGSDGLNHLVKDMQQRFELLQPSKEDENEMNMLLAKHSAGVAFRKCSGLVLEYVGFIENGC